MDTVAQSYVDEFLCEKYNSIDSWYKYKVTKGVKVIDAREGINHDRMLCKV